MPTTLHSFDHKELESYLRRHVAEFGELEAVTKFPDGQSNPTYRVATNGKTYVLRAKPPGRLLKSAHQVDREFRVMSALAATDVAVPRMLHLSAEDSPIGTMFFVMEYVDGRIFWNPALPELSRSERAEVFDAMNRTLAALHGADPARLGLADYGRAGNYFARQVDRWTRQYKASELDPLPDVDWIAGWLRDNLPDDSGAVSVVHGDYRLDNIIFDHDKPQIAAVLDWELSTLGHPLADLAYQCMQLRLPNTREFLRGLGGIDRDALGIPAETDYVENYCARCGIGPIENWSFYIVFCYFRLAAILQGVVHRAVEGNASNPGNLDALRRTVAELACDARAALATDQG
ncbi:MAG: phosphotransferase family protein [Gammaproteobacteria bacterium]